MNVLLKNYSKKTVVNFICLNKEFVIVIVIVVTTKTADKTGLLAHSLTHDP